MEGVALLPPPTRLDSRDGSRQLLGLQTIPLPPAAVPELGQMPRPLPDTSPASSSSILLLPLLRGSLWRLGWLCWPAMPLPLQSCSSPYKAAQSLLAITLVPTAPVQSWALEESSCLEGLEARELAWFAWVGLVHMGESSLGL